MTAQGYDGSAAGEDSSNLCGLSNRRAFMEQQLESRREFHQHALGSLLTFSLLETLFRHDLWAEEIKPITTRWVADVNQLGLDLRGQKLEQLAWQKKMEELL